MKRMVYKPKNISKSMTTGVCIGIGIALLISALLTTGLTSLIINENTGENGCGIFIFTIRAVSILIGGIIATVIYQEKYLPVIGITALGYLVILLGIGIVVYDGSFQHFGSGIISVLTGSLLAWAIRLKPKTKSKYLKKYTK